MRSRAFLCALVLAAFTGLGALGACASSRVADPDGGGDDTDSAVEIDAPIDAQLIDAIDAPVCSGSPCSILDQCGCEGTPTTPVCDLDFDMLSTGATECRARNDSVAGDETTPCNFNSTCGPRHVCVGGRCRKYCGGDDECAGAGGLCIIELTYGNPPMAIPGAPLTCTTDCVPTQTSNVTCPPSWACHIFFEDPTPGAPESGDERYLTDCLAAGSVQSGGACTSSQQCAAGLDCVTLNPGGQQCRPTCLCPGGNCAVGSCPAGTGSCRGFAPPVDIGGTTYGVCF